jgi:purine-cytosine permease-like protein
MSDLCTASVYGVRIIVLIVNFYIIRRACANSKSFRESNLVVPASHWISSLVVALIQLFVEINGIATKTIPLPGIINTIGIAFLKFWLVLLIVQSLYWLGDVFRSLISNYRLRQIADQVDGDVDGYLE